MIGSRTGTLVLLAAACVGASALVVTAPGTMMPALSPADAAVFIAVWAAMMTAMMIPSAAPLILLYRRAGGGVATAALAGGYLAVWILFGAVVYAAHAGVGLAVDGAAQTRWAGVVLLAAAAYQLTPLKEACLRQCRSPLGFLMQRWRSSAAGAARLGAEHGLYCLGCCWLLMVVLVAAGAMNLVWVGVIAAAVAAEKLIPRGRLVARTLAVGLALYGTMVLIG